jgi:hypothetical protein
MQFLQLFFDVLLTRGPQQPIIGYLPFATRMELPRLEAHNPVDIYSHVEYIQNLVNNIKREQNEEVYLHAFNVPFTRLNTKLWRHLQRILST